MKKFVFFVIAVILIVGFAAVHAMNLVSGNDGRAALFIMGFLVIGGIAAAATLIVRGSDRVLIISCAVVVMGYLTVITVRSTEKALLHLNTVYTVVQVGDAEFICTSEPFFGKKEPAVTKVDSRLLHSRCELVPGIRFQVSTVIYPSTAQPEQYAMCLTSQ